MTRKLAAPLFAAGLVLSVSGGPAFSASPGEIPPEVDPGTPTYTGDENPVPDEPVEFDPAANMLQDIYDADLADRDSFWMDEILERPAGGSGGNELYTRGRALYMASHSPSTLGFAAGGGTANQGGGGWAYRESPAPPAQSMYTVAVSGANLSEDTAERRQYPSHWTSVHNATGLSVDQTKFITHNNVAVTLLTLTNTGDTETTRTVNADSPLTTAAAGGTEGTGTVTTRYGVTTITARFSGEGFAVTPAGGDLTRTVTLAPGASTTLKLQLGTTAAEIPESGPEYERYRDYDADEALATQLEEYNQWWADNVPYIDVPDQNVKKMSYYRTFLNRFNLVDANIPGNDYQFPVSVEGALGYNNAIQLTQPMHMQDLKYFRDPIYTYGNLLSSGETSKCDAFIDNPGSHSWGNTYEQYISREAWNSYKVHGGDRELVENFAKYAECDVKGQLNKYDSNDNNLIEYNVGFLTGNDADTPTFHWPQYRGLPVRQDRAETAFLYSGARAAAEAYDLLGADAKAAEMDAMSNDLRDAILDILWDDSEITDPPVLQPVPATRIAGQAGFGNAVRLNGPEPNQFVDMPDGIVNGLTDMTIATWVNWNGSQNWSRVFDFGTGTTVNMFLTPNAGGSPGARFAITTGGGGNEEQITADDPLPTGWHHVAVTLSGTTGTLWVDGAAVATNTDITLDPASMGNTTNNWIGRSQYSDPLLNAAVDDFNIFGRALSQAEIQALMTSPGGGDVASYRFDEDGGADALDSSGNDRHATVETTPQFVGEFPGQVFKHQVVANGEPVQWKDQQNFTPFIEGVVPTDDESYRDALRYYADADEFPIMPSYTSNQRDKAMSQAVGVSSSNNFSNINTTLQAQVFSSALRNYPSEHITPGMYRALLEWTTWTQFVSGNNQLPNNNEFFFSWDPADQTFGRSGIDHNILGAYNFMLIDDIAGVRPRLDETLELWPIDVGWDYFTVNNLNYHGRDMTVVWNNPDNPHYDSAPEGYSIYLDGERIFTLDDLAHVTWDAATGKVTVLDGSDTKATFRTGAELDPATKISLRDNDRMADMLQKAGRDITDESGWAVNHAEDKPVAASFTASSPALRATSAEHAVDGFTISGLPASGPGGQARPGYLAPNTIWGTQGSPNSEDWLEVDLGQPRKIDTVKLYFFSDKSYSPQQNSSNNTYREPSSYTVQYHDGNDWVDVPDQVKTPEVPLPNYNTVEFPQVTVERLRVLTTRAGDFGVGIKEVQAFNTTPTSVAAIRALVEQFADGGQVTRSGEARLLARVRRAEGVEHAPDNPALREVALQALNEFVELAADPRVVPDQAAQHALVDEGEQMIAQLGGFSPPLG